MTGTRDLKDRILATRLAILQKFSTKKFTLDNRNSCSYNQRVTASAQELGRNSRMDKKQALDYVRQFSPEQVTRLIALLEGVLRNQTDDQCSEESVS